MPRVNDWCIRWNHFRIVRYGPNAIIDNKNLNDGETAKRLTESNSPVLNWAFASTEIQTSKGVSRFESGPRRLSYLILSYLMTWFLSLLINSNYIGRNQMIFKKYGYTTPTCFFCGGSATTRNKEGVESCRKCSTKSSDGMKCPVDNSELEPRTGKFGSYFFCWNCNKNWSKYHIKRSNSL